jgi:hypothetical protein
MSTMASLKRRLEGAALGPAFTACLALLTAAGTTETWVHPAYAGTDYRQGLATLAAALLLTIVCSARALRVIDERRYFMAGFPLAAVALAIPLWFFTVVVGSTPTGPGAELIRRTLIQTTFNPPSPLMGGNGIWMSGAGATCALASLCWQLLAWRRVLAADPFRTAPVSIGAAFAFFVAFGAVSPWSSGHGWSELGIEQRPGLVAMAVAGVAIAICWRRARGEISRTAYLAWGVIAGAAMLAAPLYFFRTTVGDPAKSFGPSLAGCFNGCPSVHAATGLYVSVVAALGFVATLLVDRFAAESEREPEQATPALERWSLDDLT